MMKNFYNNLVGILSIHSPYYDKDQLNELVNKSNTCKQDRTLIRIILIIIICRNRHRILVFNVAGCLILGRRRWSVTYISPRELRISEFFRIWNRRAFQERKPYQFPGWVKNSPYYCPGRALLVPHPTSSSIGRRWNIWIFHLAYWYSTLSC